MKARALSAAITLVVCSGCRTADSALTADQVALETSIPLPAITCPGGEGAFLAEPGAAGPSGARMGQHNSFFFDLHVPVITFEP